MRNVSEAFHVWYVDCERLLTLLLRQRFARGRCRWIACRKCWGLLNCQVVHFLQPCILFPDVYLRYPFRYDLEGGFFFSFFLQHPRTRGCKKRRWCIWSFSLSRSAASMHTYRLRWGNWGLGHAELRRSKLHCLFSYGLGNARRRTKVVAKLVIECILSRHPSLCKMSTFITSRSFELFHWSCWAMHLINDKTLNSKNLKIM